ncbi:MAG: HEPN domain-containing protein [Dehalococcoidia bacterium]|nr:HEPN domain-containing protein [Dehalococcoidia bacterium]
MARTRKPTPLEAFNSNIGDAEALVTYARAFRNRRKNRMPKKLQERVGDAFKVPAKKWAGLDCLQNDHLVVVFMPNGGMGRHQFDDRRPLLRQAVVAACAALETYVADKAMRFVGKALRADQLTPRLREITLTLGHWDDIKKKGLKRPVWAIRPVVEEAIRETSSTAPSSIGKVLAIVGVQGWSKKVDGARTVEYGTTERELERLADRRNRIAHSADRTGQRRATIDLAEVESYITLTKSVVGALEAVLKAHKI